MSEINVPVKLDLTALDIDAMVRQAVLDSKIGQSLKKVINDRCSGYQFEDSIRSAVDTCLKEAINKVLHTPEFEQRVAAIIKEKLTEDVVVKIINKLWEGRYS